ncbi:MAG: tRNA (adenosine(37)-N6)-threonylcarbamoyltransferase complex dimerization subunit type 1 TsaB [Propionibacteriaceae bacterium]|nr:tRNA (adenosine(37)-N6)-threonylcarbamoyltransferase complex dimerization subunit type 1 TsaB [Propionibacteriaceae bacterium]
MSELVLGIDTSTCVCVGLADRERVLASRLVGDTRSHVELLAQTVAEVVAQAGAELSDVGRIGVGVGPGPFTGLRVGIATARVLGEALGVPVTGVCGLDVIAGYAPSGGPFLAVSDARRHEVYWARYDASGLRVDGPFVGPPSSLPELPAFGPAVAVYPQLARGGDVLGVDAGWLAAHLDMLPDVGLEPLYLRQPDAEVASTRKSTLVSGRLRLPIGGPQ